MPPPTEGDCVLLLHREWMDKILDGRKTLEIRGQACRKPVGTRVFLAASGTGRVWGHVTFLGSDGPLDAAAFDALRGEHLVPHASPYRLTHAWRLGDPVRLETSVPYRHPRGAQSWVRFVDAQ